MLWYELKNEVFTKKIAFDFKALFFEYNPKYALSHSLT